MDLGPVALTPQPGVSFPIGSLSTIVRLDAGVAIAWTSACGAILTFAVWAGLSLGAAAQPVDLPTQLSLADALQLAEARSPRLAAARNRVAITEADRVDASRRPNPAISVESEGYPLLESSRPSFFNTQEFTVRFDQEIEMAGRRRLRREAADEAVAAGRARFADERRRLQFDVRRTYFQVVLAKADLDVALGALSEVDRSLTPVRGDLGSDLGRRRSEGH